MPTRAEHHQRGRHARLVRPAWQADEVGICLVLAAVWDRVEPEARWALLLPFLQAAGVTPLPEQDDVEVWREVPWRTPGAVGDQRLDLLVVVRSWGTVVVEAKVHQHYWYQSGPQKMPAYLGELRRRMGDPGPDRVAGPNGAVLALTPLPVAGTDLPEAAEGIGVGALTWARVARAAREVVANDRLPLASTLLPELIGVLEESGLGHPLRDHEASMLDDLPNLFDRLAQLIPAVDDYLTALGREAEALGLIEVETQGMASTTPTSRSFRAPWACWVIQGAARENASVAVIIDLDRSEAHFLAGLEADADLTIEQGFARALVGGGIEGDVRLFSWSEGHFGWWPASVSGANELDGEPVRVNAEDVEWEWRGLGFSVPLAQGGAGVFGANMLRTHLHLLEARLAPLAARVGRSDLQAFSTRPPIAAVLETLRRWPPKASPEIPRAVERDGAQKPFGWGGEGVVEAWWRRLTDVDGHVHAAAPKRGKWSIPLISKDLYVGADGPRCCGVRITPGRVGLKTTCPVCGRKWWNKDIRALM